MEQEEPPWGLPETQADITAAMQRDEMRAPSVVDMDRRVAAQQILDGIYERDLQARNDAVVFLIRPWKSFRFHRGFVLQNIMFVTPLFGVTKHCF